MISEIAMTDAIRIDLVQLGDLVTRPAFVIAGVQAAFDDTNKSGIPALWPRLIASLALPGQVDARSYGAMWSENPGQGSAHYMAGVEVAGEAALPAGFQRLAIAAQSYVVFRQTLDGSALHPQMQAAAKEIWGVRLPKSGFKLVRSPDFELYAEDFAPTRKGAFVDVYVPVAR